MRRRYALALALVLLGVSVLSLAISYKRASAEKKFALALQETPHHRLYPLFEEYFDTIGPQKMMDVLQRTFPICHSQAHDLGKLIYEKTGEDINKSIEACGRGCTSGCFHGVFKEAFASLSPEDGGLLSIEQVGVKIRGICADPRTLKVQNEGSCAHGAGHALLYLSHYDLGKAIGLCTSFFSTKPLQYYCANGEFMEYFMTMAPEPQQKGFFFPCSSLSSEFASACYSYKAANSLKEAGGFDALVAKCSRLDGFARLGCFHGVGPAMAEELARDPGKIAEVCRSGTADDEKSCIEGGIAVLADNSKEKAQTACDSLAGELQAVCRATASQEAFTVERDFRLYFRE